MSFLTLIISASLSATPIWHRPDSLIARPQSDSVAYMEDYTTFSVLRSTDTVPSSLWDFVANDTLRSGVMTDGIYSAAAGHIRSRHPRDFSRWSVYAYHSGIRMDSTLSYTLRLDTGSVEMEEFVFFPGSLTRLESAAWQTYLALKYGVTLDYAPYVSPMRDTLWNPESDADYYHRIVGIGSDSLHQWSASCSSSKENATLQLAAPEPLAEGEYVLLGDNDGEESWSLMPDGRSALLRSWRMRRHSTIPKPVSLVWHPTVSVSYPDSVRLDVGDDWPAGHIRLAPDSIVGDSVYWFTYGGTEPVINFSISTIENALSASPTKDAIYDASSGLVSISSLDPDKVYSYALYTNVGHLLYRPAPSRPTNINVGNLPTGVYSLEVLDGNHFVASFPLVVH